MEKFVSRFLKVGRSSVRYGTYQHLGASDKDLVAAAAPWKLSIEPD
jgi:hypothetical protein